jgi:hypothetical protein
MNEIGKQAAFYRGYLPDDRSLVPLTVLLSTTLALWLLVYLVAGVAETDQDAGARHVACGQCTRTIEEVASLVVYATQAFGLQPSQATPASSATRPAYVSASCPSRPHHPGDRRRQSGVPCII